MRLDFTHIRLPAFLIMGLLLASSLPMPSYGFEGGDHSGGGDGCLLKLRGLKDDVLNVTSQLQSLQAAGINTADLKSKLISAQFSIGENLTKNGAPVDALNFPDQSLIMIDKNTCEMALATLSDGMSLLIHETLGLMQVDDVDNKISKNVWNELSKIIVIKTQPQWNYVCTIKRFHGGSQNLLQNLGIEPSPGPNEILSEMQLGHSSFGYSSSGETPYLLGREDHDTDHYLVFLEIDSGNYGEREPSLLYSFIYNPDLKHPTNIRLNGDVPTEVKFDEFGRAAIQLLDSSAFKDKKSRLEMDCFRSI